MRQLLAGSSSGGSSPATLDKQQPSIVVHDAASVTSFGAHLEQPQNDASMIRASVRMNTILLVGKAAAAGMSSSPAILASLVDSAVDVLVQAALAWANSAARRGATSAMYPVGRGQLEPVAVVVCAALKCAGMVAVFTRSVDLLLELDQDVTKNGCLHPHDVHKQCGPAANRAFGRRTAHVLARVVAAA